MPYSIRVSQIRNYPGTTQSHFTIDVKPDTISGAINVKHGHDLVNYQCQTLGMILCYRCQTRHNLINYQCQALDSILSYQCQAGYNHVNYQCQTLTTILSYKCQTEHSLVNYQFQTLGMILTINVKLDSIS